MTKLHRSELLRELKAEFPDLAPSLNAEQGQLYFEVEAFRQFAQRAVIDGDRERTAQCFAIADRYFRLGNSEMRQTIDTGFVELFEFSSSRTDRSWAWEMLPPALKEAYVRFHGKPAV